jgi:hypothetical protein
MELNHLPKIDPTKNETGCCPRFDPSTWEGQELHFKDKPFVRAKTRSVFHIPLNMGSVFASTMKAIQDAHADDQEFAVLSHDLSAWTGEHLFAVTKDVPGLENIKLSGDFITQVFEGPYSDTAKWCKEMESFAASKGKRIDSLYYFYTTCPKCAKQYGKNYVVAVAQVSPAAQTAIAA